MTNFSQVGYNIVDGVKIYLAELFVLTQPPGTGEDKQGGIFSFSFVAGYFLGAIKKEPRGSLNFVSIVVK